MSGQSHADLAVFLQVRTLKQQNNALADEASNAKFKLVDAQQEQLKLKGQIVEVTCFIICRFPASLCRECINSCVCCKCNNMKQTHW